MNELTKKLLEIKDSYYGFVVAVLTYINNNKEKRYDIVKEFLEKNPSAGTSEILEFISDQEDFYDDAAYANVG